MFLFSFLSFVKELADLNIIFLLNNGNHLFERRCVPRVLVVHVWIQIFTHDTLEIYVGQILYIWFVFLYFLIIIQNLSGLDFTWIFDVLILTNIF